MGKKMTPKEISSRESKKVVSIIFADIIGSTEALSFISSEVARTYIQTQIDAMTSAAQKFGGQVIKTQGDGVIALFGHLSDTEDHALRAAYAGIMMIRDCRKIGDANAQVKYKGLRVGLHSGYVVISQSGSARESQTDTFGLTTHIASKLQTAAPVDHICMSTSTQALLARFMPPKLFKLVSIGEGVDPVSSYIIDAFGADTSDSSFKIGTSYNEIIGRDHEISNVDDLVDFSNPEPAKSLIILGEAGIGKTRFVDEISNKITAKSITQIALSGVDVMKDTPFFVVRQILLSVQLDEITLMEDEEREGLEILQSMDPLRMQKWRVPEYKKVAAIYSGFFKILEHLNRYKPLVVIAEDLHFFDEESLNFVVQLLKVSQSSSQIAIIGTSRNPLPVQLENKFTGSKNLQPLSEDQSKKLVLSIASQFSGQANETTIASIVSSSKGSPLALTEFTKLQLSQNRTSDGPMPLSIEPVMRSRVETLSTEGRYLTNLLCLIGSASDLDTLEGLSEWSRYEIKAIVDECVNRGILKKTTLGKYNFTHDLYRLTCLNEISDTDKVILHQKIYDFLNADAGKSAVPNRQLMVRQAFGAGHTGDALKHLKAAFAEANSLGAIRTVRNLFNQADVFCNEIEHSAFHKARFAMLSFDATHRLAEEKNLLPVYIEALDQYEEKFSFNELIVIRTHIAIIYWTKGESFKGLAFASDAIGAVEKTDHLGLECIAVYTQACLEFSLGYLESAVNRIRRQVKKMPQELSRKKWGQSVSIPSVVLQTFGAWFAADTGNFDLSETFLDEAEKTLERYSNTYGFVLSQLGRGYVFLRTKQYSEGGEILRAVYDVARVSTLSLAPMTAAWAALCLIETGEVEKAQKLLDQEFASGRPEIIRNANLVYLYLARSNLEAALGDYKNAENWINRALSLGRSNGDLISVAYCYADYAKVLGSQNSPNPDRIRYLKNALEISEQCGMKPLIAECQAQLAKLT